MADITPKHVSTVLSQVQQAFASNYQKLKELQDIRQLLLYTQQLKWTTEDIPPQYHNLRRTTDIVSDESGDNLFLRKVESQSCTIYHYKVSTNQWQLRTYTCPYYRCSMAYHNNLMIIGGASSRDDKAPCTGEILGFINNKWHPIFPAMPTRRSRSIALTCHFNQAVLLIVIGGEDDADTSLKTVEILDLTNPQNGWQRACDTPETLCSSSGTIAGDYIYILTGWSKRNNPSSAAFRCRIEDLIDSINQPIATNVWETLPQLPVEEATCTSFRNTVIVVGGRANSVAVHDIRTYNPQFKRWEVIGYLPHPRYICFAIGLPDKLIVIGGRKDTADKENTIDILQQIVQ